MASDAPLLSPRALGDRPARADAAGGKKSGRARPSSSPLRPALSVPVPDEGADPGPGKSVASAEQEERREKLDIGSGLPSSRASALKQTAEPSELSNSLVEGLAHFSSSSLPSSAYTFSSCTALSSNILPDSVLQQDPFSAEIDDAVHVGAAEAREARGEVVEGGDVRCRGARDRASEAEGEAERRMPEKPTESFEVYESAASTNVVDSSGGYGSSTGVATHSRGSVKEGAVEGERDKACGRAAEQVDTAIEEDSEDTEVGIQAVATPSSSASAGSAGAMGCACAIDEQTQGRRRQSRQGEGPGRLLDHPEAKRELAHAGDWRGEGDSQDGATRNLVTGLRAPERAEFSLNAMKTNIFVFQIPVFWTEDDLRQHFCEWGTITSVRVERKSDGRNLGYGFVCFADSESAQRAVNEMDGRVIQGKKLQVSLKKPRQPDASVVFTGDESGCAPQFGPSHGRHGSGNEGVRLRKANLEDGDADVSKDEQMGIQPGRGRAGGPHDSRAKGNVRCSLFVFHVPPNWGDEQLQKYFELYGRCAGAVVVRRWDGTSKGYGFVDFEDAESALRALQEANQAAVEGKRLKVLLKTDPKKRPTSGCGPSAAPPGAGRAQGAHRGEGVAHPSHASRARHGRGWSASRPGFSSAQERGEALRDDGFADRRGPHRGVQEANGFHRVERGTDGEQTGGAKRDRGDPREHPPSSSPRAQAVLPVTESSAHSAPARPLSRFAQDVAVPHRHTRDPCQRQDWQSPCMQTGGASDPRSSERGTCGVSEVALAASCRSRPLAEDARAVEEAAAGLDLLGAADEKDRSRQGRGVVSSREEGGSSPHAGRRCSFEGERRDKVEACAGDTGKRQLLSPCAPGNTAGVCTEMRGGRSRGNGESSLSRGKRGDRGSGDRYGKPECTVFIFHVPPEWNDRDLRRHFRHFGHIHTATVQRDKGDGQSRGFGFITFGSPAAALNAVAGMNGFHTGNKYLKVMLKSTDKRDNKGGSEEGTQRDTDGEKRRERGGDGASLGRRAGYSSNRGAPVTGRPNSRERRRGDRGDPGGCGAPLSALAVERATAGRQGGARPSGGGCGGGSAAPRRQDGRERPRGDVSQPCSSPRSSAAQHRMQTDSRSVEPAGTTGFASASCSSSSACYGSAPRAPPETVLYSQALVSPVQMPPEGASQARERGEADEGQRGVIPSSSSSSAPLPPFAGGATATASGSRGGRSVRLVCGGTPEAFPRLHTAEGDRATQLAPGAETSGGGAGGVVLRAVSDPAPRASRSASGSSSSGSLTGLQAPPLHRAQASLRGTPPPPLHQRQQMSVGKTGLVPRGQGGSSSSSPAFATSEGAFLQYRHYDHQHHLGSSSATPGSFHGSPVLPNTSSQD
ncbi:hypothetical protein BESB_043780 [Besnoitia besnoiti]|uniref:RRM domain-containing protein n=1 Tax=Besnoitia besnoiti TaxID=94643 RepID=A0A2A9MJP5_BESBE|nr:hypothetical protein BESB_043780 [Besnoitia besnoiti]PFH36186.1 hypothetical protein BESB_043780 [Besnoitia besnoiti]